jgi:HAD superfamily hydrolase (TIGR01509 family)
MLNENIKAVIFDFFGVICHEVNPAWFYKDREKFNLSIEEYREICKKVDLGEISQDQFISFYADKTGIGYENLSNALDNYARIDPEIIKLIRELKGKYKIGLLSSADGDFLRGLVKKHNIKIEDLFDSIIISSEVKMMKPDSEIYKMSLSELSVLPEEAIFIDDRQKNITGAENVGIKSILYKDINDLKLKLGC